jgi:hypothetical protein
LHFSFFKPGQLVFDTVYTPEQTLLVKEAKQQGCTVVTGVDMFVRQAVLQFKHFTGQALKRYTIPLPPLAEQKRIHDFVVADKGTAKEALDGLLADWKKVFKEDGKTK